MSVEFVPSVLLRPIFLRELKKRERPIRHGGAPSNGMCDLKEELSALTGRKVDSIEKIIRRIVNDGTRVKFSIADEFLTVLDLTYLWHADDGLRGFYEQ